MDNYSKNLEHFIKIFDVQAPSKDDMPHLQTMFGIYKKSMVPGLAAWYTLINYDEQRKIKERIQNYGKN